MKIQISLSVPTTNNPNPKGWRTVIRETLELKDLDVSKGKDQAIANIMTVLTNQIRKIK